MKLDPLDKPDITEKQFSSQVEDLLNIFGWHWCHFRVAQTERGWRTALSGHQGFPDYIAVRSSRLLIFELKSEKGKVSEEQFEWLEALGRVKAEVYVWRPSEVDEIEAILSQGKD